MKRFGILLAIAAFGAALVRVARLRHIAGIAAAAGTTAAGIAGILLITAIEWVPLWLWLWTWISGPRDRSSDSSCRCEPRPGDGRAWRPSRNYCATPVRTCLLYEPDGLGQAVPAGSTARCGDCVE